MKTRKKTAKTPMLKREDGCHFLLMPRFFRQILTNEAGFTGYYYRQTKRAELKKFFKGLPSTDIDLFTMSIGGHYSGERYYHSMWFVKFYGDSKTMCIGCQFFTASETRKIRRWALSMGRRIV